MWYAGLVPGDVSMNVKLDEDSLWPLLLRMYPVCAIASFVAPFQSSTTGAARTPTDV